MFYSLSGAQGTLRPRMRSPEKRYIMYMHWVEDLYVHLYHLYQPLWIGHALCHKTVETGTQTFDFYR